MGCSCPSRRSSVPEQNSAETQEASDVFLAPADHRTGEAVSPAEVPRVGREIGTRQGPQDDRRSGQDVVSESTHQVAVSLHARCMLELHAFVLFKSNLLMQKGQLATNNAV